VVVELARRPVVAAIVVVTPLPRIPVVVVSTSVVVITTVVVALPRILALPSILALPRALPATLPNVVPTPSAVVVLVVVNVVGVSEQMSSVLQIVSKQLDSKTRLLSLDLVND